MNEALESEAFRLVGARRLAGVPRLPRGDVEDEVQLTSPLTARLARAAAFASRACSGDWRPGSDSRRACASWRALSTRRTLVKSATSSSGTPLWRVPK